MAVHISGIEKVQNAIGTRDGHRRPAAEGIGRFAQRSIHIAIRRACLYGLAGSESLREHRQGVLISFNELVHQTGSTHALAGEGGSGRQNKQVHQGDVPSRQRDLFR